METGDTKQRILLAVAEDDPLHLYLIQKLLKPNKHFSILFTATNGGDLIDLLGTAATLPDIIVLDISMPVMSGYETLPAIKKKWPGIKVLVLSAYSRDYSIVRFLKDGASGFLSKNHMDELGTALLSIYENDYYYSKHASKDIFTKVQKGKMDAPDISEKEMELLTLMCSGDSYEDIATKMSISKRTVEVHRDNLFKKFNVNSRPGLIMFALQNEIVPL